MDKIRIMVQYNGEWINKGGNLMYEGGKAKGILLSKNVGYEELHKVVCRALDISPIEFAILMKFKCKTCDATPPIEVFNDSDVESFIAKVSDVMTRNALCIILERKGDSIAAVLVGEEECATKVGLLDAALKCFSSKVLDYTKATMSDEGVMGVDKYEDLIFDHFGTEAADVCRSPLAPMEASPFDRVDNAKEKKLNSEQVV